MQYFLLVVLWIIWCALHSALITPVVTGRLENRYPAFYRYYRILYNLLAIATLIPVLFYTFSLQTEPLFAWQGPWRFVQLLLIAISLFLFIAGGRRYDALQFLGVRQIKSGEKRCAALTPVLTDDCSLDTRGVLAWVRHPWYTAGILIVWARPLDPAAVWTNLVVSGYFVVGAILEERKLKLQFGRQYADYQQRVSMFFPVKKVKRLLRQKNDDR